MRKYLYTILILLMIMATPISASASFVDDGYGSFGGGDDPAPAPKPDPGPAPAPQQPTQPTQQTPSGGGSGSGSGKKKPTQKTSYEELKITDVEEGKNLTLEIYYSDVNDFYVNAAGKKITFPKDVEQASVSSYYTDQEDGYLSKNGLSTLPSQKIHLTKDEQDVQFKKGDNSVGTIEDTEKYNKKTYVIENATAGEYTLFYKKDSKCAVSFSTQDIYIVSLLNETKPVITKEETATDADAASNEPAETEEAQEEEAEETEESKDAPMFEGDPEFAYLTIDATDKDADISIEGNPYTSIPKESVQEDPDAGVSHIMMYADINSPILYVRPVSKKDEKAAIVKTQALACNIQVSQSAITDDTLSFTVNIETNTDVTFACEVMQNGEKIWNETLTSNQGAKDYSIPLDVTPGKYEYKLHLYTENAAFSDKVMEDTLLATFEKQEEVVSENTVEEPEPTPEPKPEPEPQPKEPFQMDNQTRIIITAVSYVINLVVYLIIFVMIGRMKKKKEEKEEE